MVKNCGDCNVGTKNTNAILCNKCKVWFHIRCVNITVNQLNKYHKELQNPRGDRWNCETCLENDRTQVSPRNSLSSPEQSKQYTLNDIMEKLNKMEMQYSDLIIKYENQLKVNDELRSELADIKAQLNSKTISDVNENFQEFNERQVRQKNLMIFGYSEVEAESESARKEEDTKAAIELINSLCPEVKTEGWKVFRVGLKTPHKPRPIKIITSSPAEVTSVIRQAKELRKNASYTKVTLSYDRTPKQILEYKNLRTSLMQRIQQGESNLKIKYYNGIPKIVKFNEALN